MWHPLSVKSWQSLLRQAAVARLVYFARGLRPWSLVFPKSGKNFRIPLTNMMPLMMVKLADTCHAIHVLNEDIRFYISDGYNS
jgi:hypothetical protein